MNNDPANIFGSRLSKGYTLGHKLCIYILYININRFYREFKL